MIRTAKHQRALFPPMQLALNAKATDYPTNKENSGLVFFPFAGQDDFVADFPIALSSSHVEPQRALLAYSIFS